VEFPESGLPAREILDQAEKLRALPHVSVMTDTKVESVTGDWGRWSVSVFGPAGRNTIKAGAVIVATGSSTTEVPGLYGLGRLQRVMTQAAFEQVVSGGAGADRKFVFIQCAGGRTAERPYCSRTCCMVGIKQAGFIARCVPDAQVHFLFRDIQVGGSNLASILYHAAHWGVRFVRFAAENPPVVGDAAVAVNDVLSGRQLVLPYDTVVLACPTVPAEGTASVCAGLPFSPDKYGFLAEPLMRARPLDHPDRSVFVAGAAHWPCTMQEAAQQGAQAASRALHMLERPGTNHPAVARVAPETCMACGLCQEACGFGAVKVTKGPDGLKAVVDPMACKGCGTCVGGCPVHAISHTHWTCEQLRAQMAAGIRGHGG